MFLKKSQYLKLVMTTGVVALSASFVSAPAFALSTDLGIDNLEASLVTDVRYAIGVRTSSRNEAVGNSTFFDQSDWRFDAGDIVTSRLDATPQFSLRYSPSSWGPVTSFGMRVSGNVFKDFAYNKNSVACRPGTAPVGLPAGLLGPNSGAVHLPGERISYCDQRITGYRDNNGKYNGVARLRDIQGAEVGDAFAFGNFQIGDSSLSIRAGRHALFWGEALFNPYFGVSAAQGPVNLNKALTIPAISAQDLFIPVNQISGTLSATDRLSVGFQYYLPKGGWRRLEVPEGGTYLNPLDPLLNGADSFYLANLSVAGPTGNSLGLGPYVLRRDPDVNGKNHNNFGIQLKYQSDFLIDATYGLYYRRFDEIIPWLNPVAATAENQPTLIAGLGGLLQLLSNQGIDLATIPTLPGAYRAVYAKGTDLYGLSFSSKQGDVSLGADVAYSQKRALNSQLLYTAVGDDGQRARGDTLSGVLNGLYISPATELFGLKLWDSSVSILELNWSYLAKVTQGAQFYKAVNTDACRADAAIEGAPGVRGDTVDGCSSRYSLGIGMVFQPTWYQVLPGIDLNATLFLTDGLKNTSPINLQGFEGNVISSLGIGANFYNQLNVALDYHYYYTQGRTGTNLDGEPIATSFNFIGSLKDRNWVSLTVKYGF